jgi:hypothetical protein
MKYLATIFTLALALFSAVLAERFNAVCRLEPGVSIPRLPVTISVPAATMMPVILNMLA